MNKTSEFRLVRPVDVAVSGASFSSDAGGTYFDREGVLRTAPANTLRVTYDPADLSKAPYALIEKSKTNFIRNNSMQGAALGSPGASPANWSIPTAWNGLDRTIVDFGVEDGIQFIEVRYAGTIAGSSTTFFDFDSAGASPALPGQVWALSAFVRLTAGSLGPLVCQLQLDERSASMRLRETFESQGKPHIQPSTAPLSRQRRTHLLTTREDGTLYVHSRLRIGVGAGATGESIDFTIRIGQPQLERDEVTSPIKTSGTAVTRAADVVGPGAGLVYSNVPIEEPAYSAVATYDASQKVHDPTTGESYLSLSGGNVGRSLADIAFWLPMGPINRRLAFDKAVNSQSKNPDLLVYAIVPGALVSDVMLLNISGARVTVEQPASGYRRTVSLVSHEVTNWYEFYAEQPQWVGDAYFENLVPHAAGPIIIIIEAPGSTAALGCAFLGKSKVIGHTLDSLEAGVISYSSTKTDAQGNMRMVRRPNARRMSCDVYVKDEMKNEVYRLLSEFTDVELAVVASSKYTMTYQYGYLGQWSVPLRRNEPVRIEFKGLI